MAAPVGQFGAGGGFPGATEGRGAPAPAIDPATGLPAAGPGAGASAPEAVDVAAVQIKLTLTDVRLADVLDAITLVADHPQVVFNFLRGGFGVCEIEMH